MSYVFRWPGRCPAVPAPSGQAAEQPPPRPQARREPPGLPPDTVPRWGTGPDGDFDPCGNGPLAAAEVTP